MRVYRLQQDGDYFQYFLTEDQKDRATLYDMDGTARAGQWRPPSVYVPYPRRPAGDFYQFSDGVLIASSYATEALLGHFEAAGELLPLPFGAQVFTVLNVTECINVLDHDRSKWLLGPTGDRLYPLDYAFHPQRFTEATLFKIPETCRAELFMLERYPDCEGEFRYDYEQAGLRGLIFVEVWNDEA